MCDIAILCVIYTKICLQQHTDIKIQESVMTNICYDYISFSVQFKLVIIFPDVSIY